MSAAAVLSECWYTMVDLGQSLFTVTCSHWVNSGPGTAGCRPFIILPAFVFARQRGWHQVETACFPQPRCPSNSNLDLFTSPSPPEWHFMTAYVYENIRCVCGTGDELPLCVCVPCCSYWPLLCNNSPKKSSVSELCPTNLFSSETACYLGYNQNMILRTAWGWHWKPQWCLLLFTLGLLLMLQTSPSTPVEWDLGVLPFSGLGPQTLTP